MKQISIRLRYILKNEPHEEFLNFKPANELNAQSLFDVILATLPKEGVDIQPCVSQSYVLFYSVIDRILIENKKIDKFGDFSCDYQV